MNYPDDADLFEGKFTDGDPVAGIPPSVDSSEDMNAVYDELLATIIAGGLTPDKTVFNQVALSIQQQIRQRRVFTAAGDVNDVVVTSTGSLVIHTLENYEEIKVRIIHTNTGLVTIKIDELPATSVVNITANNQLFAGALATFAYIDGAFYLTDQINPKTGNDVSDIGKLIVDTTNVVSPKEVLLNGATLSRIDHPIMWAKVQTTSNLVAEATKNANIQNYAGYYGDGDGSTTFTLPTLGGEFIRMADNGRGVDSGRGFASWQGDAIRNIGGKVGTRGASAWPNDPENIFEGAFRRSNNLSSMDLADYRGSTSSYPIEFDASRVVPTANENRPRNIAYYAKTRI